MGSLFILLSPEFMEEKMKLVIVLAQENKHIVSSCWGKQRCIFPADRIDVRIDAIKQDIIILDIIGITQVKGVGVTLISCRCLKM